MVLVFVIFMHFINTILRRGCSCWLPSTVDCPVSQSHIYTDGSYSGGLQSLFPQQDRMKHPALFKLYYFLMGVIHTDVYLHRNERAVRFYECKYAGAL